MKAMIVSLVVALSVSPALASKKGASAVKPLAEIAKTYSVDLSKLSGEKSSPSSRQAEVQRAAPALARALQVLSSDTINKLSIIEGAPELVLHMTELKTRGMTDSFNTYARLMESVGMLMEMNASSGTNKQVGKLFAVLASGKATPEIIKFAENLNIKAGENMADLNNGLKIALNQAVKDLLVSLKRDSSPDAIAKWLKDLSECLA